MTSIEKIQAILKGCGLPPKTRGYLKKKEALLVAKFLGCARLSDCFPHRNMWHPDRIPMVDRGRLTRECLSFLLVDVQRVRLDNLGCSTEATQTTTELEPDLQADDVSSAPPPVAIGIPGVTNMCGVDDAVQIESEEVPEWPPLSSTLDDIYNLLPKGMTEEASRLAITRNPESLEWNVQVVFKRE